MELQCVTVTTGYCPLLRLTTDSAENGSQPFTHESHRWPSNNKLTVYNHGLWFTIVHHDLQFGLQNKTFSKTKQQQQKMQQAFGHN